MSPYFPFSNLKPYYYSRRRRRVGKVCFLTVHLGFDLRVLEEEWGSGSVEKSGLGCRGSGFSPYSMTIPVFPPLHPKP